MKQNSFIKKLVKKIKIGLPSNFTGFGLIFVKDNTGDLPLSSLLNISNDYSEYENEKKIIDFLINISNIDDFRHDGFHVVSLTHGLTLISQYFSPPIPENFKNLQYGVGARFRTAQYGSLCNEVISVIVINQTGEISIAIKGIVKTIPV